MNSWSILSVVTFLPLLGALIIFVIPGDDAVAKNNARMAALFTTIFTFLVSLLIWFHFDNSQAGFQFVEKYDWMGENFSYHMGVDGISMLFVILTTFVMPLSILASWDSVQERVKEYMIAFLVLESLMIGVFCSLDLLMFYVFFEAGLIPMFLIIGVWGGKRRVYASFKFFLVYAAGLSAHAAGHHGHVYGCGHHRHFQVADLQVFYRTDPFLGHDHSWRIANDPLVGVLCQFRGQNAHVAGAYLVAGCACGSAHRRVGDPCRHFAEDGRLWFLALLHPHVSGRI